MAMSLRGVKTRYELKEVLARGGMGVVYKAYDKVMKRAVALKTILDLTDERAVQLFQKECEDLASLIHPNIIEIFDIGQLEDEGGVRPYLVMPLLPGVTLEKLISTSSSRLSVERCIDIFCQTCRGLHAAHERGLIHRDLKPSNIFVMDDDSVKIIDFGVAHRVSGTATVGRKGTLLYMSPEQITMMPLTPSSDIFSLGVVCYEALTHRRPFERTEEDDAVRAILHFMPPAIHELNGAVPPVLSQAVHKAMAKNAMHRYRSAREFAEILQRAARNEPVEMFSSSKIQVRLQRARSAYDKSDYDYASEIVGELESEGHLDPAISQLKEDIERARLSRRIKQLIETARSRVEEQEYQIALQKIGEALELDPKNTEALSLQAKVNAQRTSKDIEEWFELARTHIANGAFGPAREALRRVLELRPREPKATQLLSEVERTEQNYLRIKQEKEQLYRAAVEADRDGDISSALSKLERVLEIDKRAPEPSRAATYQRLYDKVRTDYDSIRSARAEAKRLLEDEKFSQALALCGEYLTKYPADTLFQALKYDVQEKQRQAMSARIAEIDRAMEAEPDLDRRVSLLENGVTENPGVEHFERALQNARDKRDMVNGIVIRARNCEERNQLNESVAQWEILNTIYPRYPGLTFEIARVNKLREQMRIQETRARWVEQIEQHLDAGDFTRANELARMAEEELPNDPELAELARLGQQGLERHVQAQQLLQAGQAACESGSFEEGLEKLRRSLELDSSNEKTRRTLVEMLVEQGRRVLDNDPNFAKTLLDGALELEPEHALATSLIRMLADQKKSKLIDNILAQARRLQAEGQLKSATDSITEALRKFPGDARLLRLEATLRKAVRELRNRELERAKRIAREVDNSAQIDDEKRTRYSGNLDDYLVRYGEDDEFSEVVHQARRRLETVAERSSVPRPRESSHSGDLWASRVSIEPVPSDHARPGYAETGPVSAGTPSREKLPDLAQPLLPSFDRQKNDRQNKFRLPRKHLFTISAVASAFLLLIVAGLLSKHKPQPPKPIPPAASSLQISVSPSDSAVFLDGVQVSQGEPRLKLERGPGSYRLEARHAGYVPQSREVELTGGKKLSAAFTLLPENPTLRVLGAGQVSIDEDPPVDIADGQFSRVLTPGEHVVKISMNRISETSFKVHVTADDLPAVSDVTAREVTPLLVSNFGQAVKIYGANSAPVPVYLAGQSVGNLDAGGLALPPLSQNVYSIALGEGSDAKIKQIEIGPARTVTALLEADPNVGTLRVETNEDDATVIVSFKEKEYVRKQTKNGHARFGNLRAHSYMVQVTKDGYETLPDQQQVEIAKATEGKLIFDLHRRPVLAELKIVSLAEAEIFLDGLPVGKAGADGRALVPKVALGPHKLEARRRGYQTRSQNIKVEEGQGNSFDLRLSQSVGRVLVVKNVPQAFVNYRKADGSATPVAIGGSTLQLPEGDYVFTASAPGYVETEVSVAVLPDQEAKVELTLVAIPKPQVASIEAVWGRQFIQATPGDWYVHKGEGFVGVPKAGPASIQFTAPLTRGRVFGSHRDKLIWAINYRDPGNYLQFELDDKELKVTQIKDGTRKALATSAMKRAAIYTVRLDWRADALAVNVNGSAARLLGADAVGAGHDGRFGFLGNKEVRLSDFRYAAAQ